MYARSVWHNGTKFPTVTQLGNRHILTVEHALQLKGQGTVAAELLGCQFLPRDAMRKRAVFAIVRCLSGKLVCYIQTAEDIVKLFVRPGSPIILVFDPMRRHQIPREALQRGRKTHRWGNFAIFAVTWSGLSSKSNGFFRIYTAHATFSQKFVKIS